MAESRQPARQLEHHQVAHHVGLDVDIGIDQRMTHAGLRGQMDDAIDVGMPLGQPENSLPGRRCRPRGSEALVLAQGLQARELQHRVVVVAEIVDAEDRFAPRQQCPRDVRTDEAGGTGYKNGHGHWG